MPTPLKLVGQRSMDLFYQNYKSNTDFFDLPDFIYYSGDTLADYYLQEYKQLKAVMRSDKQEEVVSFSENILSEQELEVETHEGAMVAKLKQPFLSFPYDEQSSGIQFIFPVSCKDCPSIIRSSLTQIWKFKHVPITNKVYWYINRPMQLALWTNSNVMLKKIRVLYVPTPTPDAEVPDTLVDFITTNTVTKMKGIAQGVVVKKAQDGNQNKIIESEINKESLVK